MLAENGQSIIIDKEGARLGNRITTGHVLIHGKSIGDVGKNILKERRALSEEGLVAVIMAFDEETGFVVYGPEILSRGFVFETATGHILEDAKCVVLEVVDETPVDDLNRIDNIRLKIQTALKKYFYFTIKRRPVILPFILEI